MRIEIISQYIWMVVVTRMIMILLV